MSTANPCLEPVGSIAIEASITRFVATAAFQIGVQMPGAVRISFVNTDFSEWFLSSDGHAENMSGRTILHYYRLREASRDIRIVAALGYDDQVETTLSRLYSLIATQPSGQPGALLTDGSPNIFYVRDSEWRLRAVNLDCCDGFWQVHANAIGDKHWWRKGGQVFSPGGSVVA